MAPPDTTAETLIAVIATLRGELEAQRAQAATEREQAKEERLQDRLEIRRLVAMVEGLTKQLELLLRDKDEVERAQLARLRAEARAALPPAAPPSGGASPAHAASPDTPTPKVRKRHEHGRSAIPPELPRDVTTDRPTVCPACQSTRLDEKNTIVSENWAYVRAHLRVQRLERIACVCRDCRAHVFPEQPPMPFDRVSCTFGLMAWLCFAKAGLFLPLDRVRRDFEDQGAHIASSTLTRWQQRGADLLFPVALAVRLSLLQGTHLRMDGTGLLVVFPRVKGSPVKGEARCGEVDDDGYLLARDPHYGQVLVFGDDHHAVYVYTQTRAGHHAVDFLTIGTADDNTPILWEGTITADALSAHDCLFTSGDRIEGGCNAHGLRKFRDNVDNAPILASRALAFVGRFFSEEADARQKGLTGAALLAWRQERIAPVADSFCTWINTHIEELLPSNPVRKAMQYYLNHWDALTRFLHDPDVPMDNNWSERALRVVNLIRNNSLYAGGEEGAVRLCTLLTLVNTCRLLKVDPYNYLEWALSRVVPHSSNAGYKAADLTPAAYKAAQKREAG